MRERSVRLVAALSLYIMSLFRLAAVVAWFTKRSRIRRRVLCTMVHSNRTIRSCWMRRDESERTKSWWDTTVPLPIFSDDHWIQHFRMTQSTFWDIVALVEKDMRPGYTHIRETIATEKRVAIALFHCAHGEEYFKTPDFFGVSMGTVYQFWRKFMEAMLKHYTRIINFPDEEEAKAIASRISDTWRCPQIFGAIGALHIPVMLKMNKQNRKCMNKLGEASYILQAVVDDKYRFRNITDLMPGGLDHSTVLENSQLFENPGLFPKSHATFNNIDVPLMLAGGPEYPPLPQLLTPYQKLHMSREEESFNLSVDNVRLYSKSAFDRLKARWHILHRKFQLTSLDTLQNTFIVCCMLHNLCESSAAPVFSDWYASLDRLQPPNRPCRFGASNNCTRDALRNYLADNFPLMRKELTVEVEWEEPMESDEEYRN